MQFKDNTKEYEIEFKKVGNVGISSTPFFTFKLSKPFHAEENFELSDYKTVRGTTGLYFGKGGAVSKAACKGKQGVMVQILDDAVEYIKQTASEELYKIKQAAQVDPETWRWSTGCDTGNLYIYPNTETRTEFRPDLREIRDTLEKAHKFDAYELFGKEEEVSLVSHTLVLKIYNEVLEARAARQAEKEAKKEAKEIHIFQKAKETGEPQVLEEYCVDCEDPEEECSTDVVKIYAMPDGSQERKQYHTY